MRDSYFPSKSDIDGYSKVLDRNSDGKVTLADLEALCIKYLVSPSGLSSLSTGSPNKYGESSKKSVLPGSYLSQSPDRVYDAYGAPNARSYDASPSRREADKKSYYTPGDYLNRSPYGEDLKRSNISNGEGLKRSPYGGEDLKRSNTPNGEVLKRSPYGEDLKRSNTPNGEGLKRSPYQEETNKRVNELLSKSSVSLKKAMISQIRRVFDKFDEDKNGFIDERELKKLMEETYRILGLKKEVSYSDIQSYLSLVDTNRDGLISYPEYEEIVTKALARINVRFE